MLARRSHFSAHVRTCWRQDAKQEWQDGDQEAQDGRREAKLRLQMDAMNFHSHEEQWAGSLKGLDFLEELMH